MTTPDRQPANAPARPRLVHLTTTDMSLDWLLAPQLRAFAAAGYEVIGMSAAGKHVEHLESMGIAHVAVPAFTRSTNCPPPSTQPPASSRRASSFRGVHRRPRGQRCAMPPARG